MKRLFVLVLSIVMLCACMMPSCAFALTKNGVDLSNAMHFIVRHWHTDDDDSGSSFQGGSLDNVNDDRYFVMVEGYIVPPAASGTGRYEFYLVCQGPGQSTYDGETYNPGDLVLIHNSGYVGDSAYIDDLDHDNGTITLSANELTKGDSDDDYLEKFSCYSISAGHGATEINGDALTIAYDPYVHLVKVHAFYVREADATGTNEPKELGELGISSSAERDTGKNSSGVKVYDTSEGLHTDKTASLNKDERFLVPDLDEDGNEQYDKEGNLLMKPDGRTFDLELEAWHSEGYAAQVGLVLDASGSMAFASDVPNTIHLSAEEIVDLKINPVDAGVATSGWDLYLLDRDQVEEILNRKNTDNSLLSASGYSYFVKDANGDYEPLGYWEGVVPATDYNFIDSGDDVRTNWPDGHSDLHFNGTNGLFIYTSQDKSPSTTGIQLDATPTSDKFTISFMIKKGGSTPAGDTNAIAPILFIGPTSGQIDDGNYFNVYRDSSTSTARLKGNQKMSRGGEIINLDAVFSNSNDYRITLVFSGNSVTAYLSNAGGTGIGTTSQGTLNTPITDKNIIINGFNTGYSGGIFYIDDVCVFDRALESGEVEQLPKDVEKYSAEALIGKYLFINGSPGGGSTERTWLMNNAVSSDRTDPNRKDAIKLKSAVSAGTAVPSIAKTQDGRVLGSINLQAGNVTSALLTSHTAAGWYLISHAGAYANHYIAGSLLTGKRLYGVSGSQSLTLTGTPANAYAKTYKPTTDVPTQFFVDEDGNLCCFFSSANDKITCSYVYELEDSKYIRTEALQRALGLFVTELNEWNPTSRVSATMFHSSDLTYNSDRSKDQLNKLVLLDWTSDPSESAAIMSLTRGITNGEVGKSIGYTTSALNNVNQFNYGLTGSTSTWRGLQAFTTYLLPNDNPYDPAVEPDVPKYLIIFTDGKDTDIGTENSAKAKALADALKEKEGYTIFTVLLDGGTMSPADYTTAETFLKSLAGPKKGEDGTGKTYFFSVKDAKDALGAKADGMNDSDILTQIFVDEILTVIVTPLEDYCVQDYIDPRFDLVDGEGRIWHLKAGGQVTIVSTDASKDEETEDDGTEGDVVEDVTLDLTTGVSYNNDPDEDYDDPKDFIPGVRITISADSDDEALKPFLCYDAARDLYYLRWYDQIIPGCVVGATKLSVWNATVTIRAKEDFIGGNAVLSNGNDANMNFVFPMGALKDDGTVDESKASSGTDKAKEETPSKGFPRTSVNVSTDREDVKLVQTIYMGEKLDKNTIASDIIEAAYDASYASDARWCWEYLGRFVEYFTDMWDQGEGSEGRKIIDHLHTINRNGDPVENENLEEGRMKIISSRIYDLIRGEKTDNNPDGERLSIKTLSALLLAESTLIGDDGTRVNERYLYIPYIYLPDDLTDPTHSTGKGEYGWDVLGYLYFHIEEKDKAGNYPDYPTTEGGITVDTQARRSTLTVSFMAHTPEDRKEWNNKEAIQEKDSDGGVIYARDTDYKPAEGEEIIDTVIKGDFTTEIVSGEIALQVVVSETAAKRIRAIGKTVTYTADLYWNENTKVGTFTAKINPANLTTYGNIITAEIKYSDPTVNGIGPYEITRCGLPKGGYTLKNAHGVNIPNGFTFGDVMLIGYENMELEDEAGEPIDPEQAKQAVQEAYKSVRYYHLGTDHDKAWEYIAASEGNLFRLGIVERGEEPDSKDYLNRRFGLYRVTLDADLSVPSTGDRNHPLLWLGMLIAGLIGLALMRRYRKSAGR